MLQMTLNMKSYSREKKMNGDYSVSSINSKLAVKGPQGPDI